MFPSCFYHHACKEQAGKSHRSFESLANSEQRALGHVRILYSHVGDNPTQVHKVYLHNQRAGLAHVLLVLFFHSLVFDFLSSEYLWKTNLHTS